MELSPIKQLVKRGFLEAKQALGKSLDDAEADFDKFRQFKSESDKQQYWNTVFEKYECKDRSESEERFFQHAMFKTGKTEKKLGERELSNEEIDKINDIFGGDPIPKVANSQ